MIIMEPLPIASTNHKKTAASSIINQLTEDSRWKDKVVKVN